MITKFKPVRKNAIQYLSRDEARDPVLYLKVHFTFADLRTHQTLLKAWYDDVLHSRTRSLNSPSNTLYYYEVTLRFLEACWLIRKHGHRPAAQSYLILRNAFDIYDLDEYKNVIREWIFASLSIVIDSDELIYRRLTVTYESLLRLNKAAFIIVNQ